VQRHLQVFEQAVGGTGVAAVRQARLAVEKAYGRESAKLPSGLGGIF
jgi:hypothetical protein